MAKHTGSLFVANHFQNSFCGPVIMGSLDKEFLANHKRILILEVLYLPLYFSLLSVKLHLQNIT